jgi:4-aminobutyrate aminotransferase-like enzyme
MSSTHSANPMVCYAGLAVLDEISDKKIIKNTRIKGKLLFNRLNLIKKKFDEDILFVGGQGLIASLIFNNKKNIAVLLKLVVMKCLKKGLLVVYTGRESIKIGPPLTISKNALVEGLDILEESISEVFSK